MSLLPKTFTLDGSSKLHVWVGPRGQDPKYQQLLGSSIYYYEDFNFAEYFALPQLQRDLRALTVLETSFLDIGPRHDEKARQVIRNACVSEKEMDFASTTRWEKLSKRNANKKVKVNVYRHLNRNDGEAWSCQVTTNDNVELHTEWIGDRPDYINRTEFYKTSRWQGDVFQICQRLGQVVHQLDIGPFLAGSVA